MVKEPSISEKEKALSFVRQFHTDSESDYAEYKTNHLKYYKAYHSYRNASKYKTRANLFIPYVFAFIENAQAQAMEEYINAPIDGDIVTLHAEEGSSDEKAYLKTKIINKQLRQMDFVRKLLDANKQGLITGSTAGKVYINDKIRYIIDSGGWTLDPAFLLPQNLLNPKKWNKENVWKETPPRERKIIDNFPTFDPQDVLDMRVQAASPDYDIQSNAVEFCKWMPLGYLESHPEIYFDVDKAGEEEYKPSEEENRGTSTPQGKREMVFLQEWWGEYEYAEGERRQWLIVVANDSVVVRYERNPFWHQMIPAVWSVDTPVPFSLYGKGEVEPIFNLQMQLNDLVNHSMDAVNLLVHPMYKMLTTSGLTNTEIMAEAGKVITLNRMEEMESFVRQDISRGIMYMMGDLKQNMQFTLSASEPVMGMSPVRQEAATTIIALQRAAGRRYAIKSWLLARYLVAQTVYHLIWLNRQFFRKPYPFSYTAKNGEKRETIIEPSIWDGEDEVSVNVDPLRLNEEVLRQQLINFYMFLEKNQVMGINKTEFLKKILRTFSEVRNLDKIVQPVKVTPELIREVATFLSKSGMGEVVLNPELAEGGGSVPGGGFNPRQAPRATTSGGVLKGVQQLGNQNIVGSSLRGR